MSETFSSHFILLLNILVFKKIGVPIVDQMVPPYSTIGPVTGSIIVLCLVIGFAMYCYRQNLDSGKSGDMIRDGRERNSVKRVSVKQTKPLNPNPSVFLFLAKYLSFHSFV